MNAPAAEIRHRSVPVALGDRSYEVLVGPGVLDALSARAEALFARGRAFIIADSQVAALHGDRIAADMQKVGVEPHLIPIAPGEESKSWAGLQQVCDTLLAHGMERREALVALGGGVTGDLAGFAAAIMKRGAPYIHIPTTLLAQVDSSVGGKTAINTIHGKNLIGAFHQPSLVLADTELLSTLSDRDLRAGVAEIIKIAALADAHFFAWLEARMEDVLAREPHALTEAVARAVALKAAIVAEDEREAGRRALLNLGHTFGHGFETAAGYDSGLRHGEAVAAGMAMAAHYAVDQGLCPVEDARRLEALIAMTGLPASPHDLAGAPFDPDAIFAIMAQDKKVLAGRLRVIAPTQIGDARVVDVEDPSGLRRFLEARLT